MKLKLNRPLVFFDIESTGLNIATDRIVELCLIKVYPDGSEEYHYEDFTLVSLNTHLGNRDIYFVPSGMGYYDVIK